MSWTSIKVVKVTNKDEHKYLDDYLDSSVIGTHALSSVLIEKRDKGEGIDVTTRTLRTVPQECMRMH